MQISFEIVRYDKNNFFWIGKIKKNGIRFGDFQDGILILKNVRKGDIFAVGDFAVGKRQKNRKKNKIEMYQVVENGNWRRINFLDNMLRII